MSARFLSPSVYLSIFLHFKLSIFFNPRRLCFGMWMFSSRTVYKTFRINGKRARGKKYSWALLPFIALAKLAVLPGFNITSCISYEKRWASKNKSTPWRALAWYVIYVTPVNPFGVIKANPRSHSNACTSHIGSYFARYTLFMYLFCCDILCTLNPAVCSLCPLIHKDHWMCILYTEWQHKYDGE